MAVEVVGVVDVVSVAGVVRVRTGLVVGDVAGLVGQTVVDLVDSHDRRQLEELTTVGLADLVVVDSFRTAIQMQSVQQLVKKSIKFSSG